MSGTWGHAVSAPRPPQGRAPFSSSRETGGEGHSRPTLQYPNVSAGHSAREDSLVSLWEQLRGSKASVLGRAGCSEAHRQHKLPLFIVSKFLYPRQVP